MKMQLSDFEADNVSGGVVLVSDRGLVGFTTTGETFNLVNCTWRQARDLRDDLYEANPGMGNAEFDNLVRNELQARGWI